MHYLLWPTPLSPDRDLCPCDSSPSLARSFVRGLPLPSQGHLSHSKHCYITAVFFFLAIWSWSQRALPSPCSLRPPPFVPRIIPQWPPCQLRSVHAHHTPGWLAQRLPIDVVVLHTEGERRVGCSYRNAGRSEHQPPSPRGRMNGKSTWVAFYLSG